MNIITIEDLQKFAKESSVKGALAKELLDWKPEIPLDLGLGNTINYFKNLINPS